MSKPIVHTPLVKICGLTNLEDTLAAIEFGADLLGFNFYPDSPRFLEIGEAALLFQEIPSSSKGWGLREYPNFRCAGFGL